MSNKIPITKDDLNKIGIKNFETEHQIQYVSDCHKETIIGIIDLVGDMKYSESLIVLKCVKYVLRSVRNSTRFRQEPE
jgi:hypothetical protein